MRREEGVVILGTYGKQFEGTLKSRVCRCKADTTASHLNQRASKGISRKRFPGGYHSCIFSYCFLSPHCYLRDAWRSKLSGLRLSPLPGGKWSKRLSAHVLTKLGQKFFNICGCDLESVGQVCEWKGFRSRRGTGLHASHILHIIGSFAGHEYEAGFGSFLFQLGLSSLQDL